MLNTIISGFISTVASKVATEIILTVKKEMEAMQISREAKEILDEYEQAESDEERAAILRKISSLHLSI